MLGTALVLIAASALEAYGSRGYRTGTSGELVWATGGIDARPGGSSYKIVAAWNQLHPNGPIVRLEILPNAPDDQRQQMVVELKDKRSDPDILSLDLVWTGEFAANGWLANLRDIRRDIVKVSQSRPVESATWDGELRAGPNTTDVPLLYYNTHYVQQPPRTWDEAMKLGLEAVRKHDIENPGTRNKKYRLVPFVGEGAPYEGMVVSYLELVRQAGGEVANPDCTKVFQEGAALKALEFMRRAREVGFFPPEFSTMKEEEARAWFQSGNAVFMRNWPYAYDLMQKPKPDDHSEVVGKFRVARLPTFTGEGTAGVLGGHNLAVSQFSDNPLAAQDFVRFVSTTRDIQRELAEKHSMAPTMASVYDELPEDSPLKLVGRILPAATPRPRTPDWNQISEKIQQLIHPAYSDSRSDPRAAVRELRAFFDAKAARGERCG